MTNAEATRTVKAVIARARRVLHAPCNDHEKAFANEATLLLKLATHLERDLNGAREKWCYAIIGDREMLQRVIELRQSDRMLKKLARPLLRSEIRAAGSAECAWIDRLTLRLELLLKFPRAMPPALAARFMGELRIWVEDLRIRVEDLRIRIAARLRR